MGPEILTQGSPYQGGGGVGGGNRVSNSAAFKSSRQALQHSPRVSGPPATEASPSKYSFFTNTRDAISQKNKWYDGNPVPGAH